MPFVAVRNPLLRKNSVEGRLLEDKSDPNKIQPKLFSFFKSLVIELDKEMYGPCGSSDTELIPPRKRMGSM